METNEVLRLAQAAEALPVILFGGMLAIAAGVAALALVARRGR